MIATSVEYYKECSVSGMDTMKLAGVKATLRILIERLYGVTGLAEFDTAIRVPCVACAKCGGHVAAGVCTACGEFEEDCDCEK